MRFYTSIELNVHTPLQEARKANRRELQNVEELIHTKGYRNITRKLLRGRFKVLHIEIEEVYV